MRAILLIISVVLLAITGLILLLGGNIGSLNIMGLGWIGLAFFAAAHLV